MVGSTVEVGRFGEGVVATCLSQRKNIFEACKFSLNYVDQAIIHAPNYGKGFGPLNHLVLFNSKNNHV